MTSRHGDHNSVQNCNVQRPWWYAEKCLWGFKAFVVEKFFDPRNLYSGWSREWKRSIDWLNLVDNPLTFRLCLNCRLAKGSLKHKVSGRDPQRVYCSFSQASKNASFGNRVSHIFFVYFCVSLWEYYSVGSYRTSSDISWDCPFDGHWSCLHIYCDVR